MCVRGAPRYWCSQCPLLVFPASRIAFLTHEHENLAQTPCCEIAEDFGLLKNGGCRPLALPAPPATGRRRYEIKLELGRDVCQTPCAVRFCPAAGYDRTEIG